MRNPNSADYGTYYWVVDVGTTVSANGRLSVWADEMKVNDHGDLVFINHYGTDGRHKFVGLLLASGNWIAAYAASVFSGAPMVVYKWKFPVRPGCSPGRMREEKERVYA